MSFLDQYAPLVIAGLVLLALVKSIGGGKGGGGGSSNGGGGNTGGQ